MKQIILSILLIISISCLAQEWATPAYIKKYNYQEVIGNITEIPEDQLPDVYAMYPDGKKGIYKLIADKTKIPQKAIRKKIEGKVVVKYIVGLDGQVEDIEILQSAHKLLDDAAVRVIKLMKRWIPAKINGKSVRIEYSQPFNFRV